jgi:hypothetical protein
MVCALRVNELVCVLVLNRRCSVISLGRMFAGQA